MKKTMSWGQYQHRRRSFGSSERGRKAENDREMGASKQFELGQRVWKRKSQYEGKRFAAVFAPRSAGP